MASRKASRGTERSASAARWAIISSGSLTKTTRISARSAGARCKPPEQTAILRSRVVRPARNSCRSSGLMGSTGLLLQVFPAQRYFTRRARRAERRHGLAVQFQQHPAGVSRGNHKLTAGPEMAGFAGVELAVEENMAVGGDADPGGDGDGDGESERGGTAGRASRRRRGLRVGGRGFGIIGTGSRADGCRSHNKGSRFSWL